MKRFLSGLAMALTTLVALGLASTLVQPAAASARWIPPHDTIVKVAGNAEDGFAIHHYDGSVLHPPTDSEARAECLEYDAKIERVRCRTEIRTWYADLADMKIALKWANRA